MCTMYDIGSGKAKSDKLTNWWILSLTVFVCILSLFVGHRLRTLPFGLTEKDLPTHNQSFIAERAWRDLTVLTGFGTRPTGSHANEVLSIDFFKRELRKIKELTHRNQNISSDIQIVSGGYYNGCNPYLRANIYRNVQNFIVRLAGSDEAEKSLHKNHALMVNCHFDSVPGRFVLFYSRRKFHNS